MCHVAPGNNWSTSVKRTTKSTVVNMKCKDSSASFALHGGGSTIRPAG